MATNTIQGKSLATKYQADISANPLHNITLTSFGLGIVFGLFLGLVKVSSMKNLNVYVISLCTFHFLEYYITAKYNQLKVNQDSFLLRNGAAYIICHASAILEYLLERRFSPYSSFMKYPKVRTSIIIFGYACIIFGQIIRSLAMMTAGKSFSHIVQIKRREDHELIQTGVYQWFRHPSYFGFYWWALGTQMILLNPVSFILFATILWKFFHDRIKTEETYLITFFGNDYIIYRANVPVRIPFIR